MKNESNELQPRSKEKESVPRVRQSFRIPLSEEASVQVLINQKKYNVSNISQGGVGISSDLLPNLKSGEILVDCELILIKEKLKGLTGEVIHYSASASGQLEHGIRWLDLKAEQRQALDKVFLQMKTRALENSDRKIKLQEEEK